MALHCSLFQNILIIRAIRDEKTRPFVQSLGQQETITIYDSKEV